MKRLLTVLLFTAITQGQNLLVANPAPPDAPSQHSFWSLEKKVSVGIFASLIAADAITTQRGLSQGFRETNPLMRPFVTHGVAGEAAGSAIGFGTGVGVVYLLHRTHHHKAERIAMQTIIGGQSVIVARNIQAIR